MQSNTQYKSRRGRNKISPPLKRNVCVSVRLNDEEKNWLDLNRQKHKRGEFLRMCAMKKLPPIVPEINITTLKVLSSCSNSLNQIARKLNSDNPINIDQVIDEINIFYNRLICFSNESEIARKDNEGHA